MLTTSPCMESSISNSSYLLDGCETVPCSVDAVGIGAVDGVVPTPWLLPKIISAAC